MLQHSGFPYHTFVHCKGFAPAAPRRAWIHVSESISGLPLSWPIPVIALGVRYTPNKLIGRGLILKRKSFRYPIIPDLDIYQVLASVSRNYP